MPDKYFTDSRTKPRLINALQFISMMRYITFDQLKTVKKPYLQHIATKNSLQILLQENFLNITENGAYSTTPVALKYMKDNGIITDLYPMRKRGEASDHTLKITQVLISLQQDTTFFTAFYPTLGDLIPDACVLYRKDDSYKIQFLEVEEEKPNWELYLVEKKAKYDRLASDFNTWDKWWRKHAERFGLPFCDVDQFCFSILCISDIKLDYQWEGWTFGA